MCNRYTILNQWIDKRNDITVDMEGNIKWSSSMHAGSYYPLVGMTLDEAEKIHTEVRKKTGYGYQDTIKLLEENDWDVDKAVKNAIKHTYKI